ncbi:MAG TPA: peptide deformylase [Anaerolineae bacterium]|nr:peptide deformylase [Anaerolineae bacterium]
MSIREIITLPNSILRKKARKVRAFTPELQMLIDDMIETMREAPGVGLAAPQVNVSQRVIVIEFAEPSDDEEPAPKLYVLINPEIVRHSKETTTDQEGCLSVPGYVGEVDRFSTLTVKGRNRHGKPVRIKAKDWLARILQHEIDHLDGVLYIDRANQVWRLEELEQQANEAGAASEAI